MEIPGFRIIEEIGSGGFATVYLAEQLSLKRQVAIKVLSSPGGDEEQWTERFLREVRIIGELDHPSIVSIYDFGKSSDGRLYYAMPYLEYGDLNWLDWRTDAELVEHLSAICDGLEHAHRHGVVHRDINPSNILLNRQGRPLIADFGIAIAQGDTERLTREGQTVGNAHYMSPEQARGEAVDGRADIYSLGAVIYELLTRQVPFRRQSTVDTILAQINDPAPELPEDCAHWQPLVHRCLEKRPEDRFDSAAELKDALQELADPSLKTRTMPIPDEAEQDRKKLISWPLVGGVGLVLLIVAAAVLWPSSSPDDVDRKARSDDVSESPAGKILVAAILRQEGEERAVELTWSGPEGSRVTIERSRNGRETRFFDTLNDGEHLDQVEKSGWYGYRVCNEGRNQCSDLLTIEF